MEKDKLMDEREEAPKTLINLTESGSLFWFWYSPTKEEGAKGCRKHLRSVNRVGEILRIAHPSCSVSYPGAYGGGCFHIHESDAHLLPLRKRLLELLPVEEKSKGGTISLSESIQAFANNIKQKTAV